MGLSDDVRTTIADLWREQLEVAEESARVADNLLGRYGWDADSEYAVVIEYLVPRAACTFRAGLELCRVGFAEEAMILSLVLFEVALNLEFIGTNPEKWAWTFVRYEALRELRDLGDRVDEIKAQGGPKAEEMTVLEAGVEELRARYGNCDQWKTWSGRRIKEMAERGGMLPRYQEVYDQLNDLVHISPYAAQRYMLTSDRTTKFRTGPSPRDIDKPLLLLCDMLFRCTTWANDVLQLGGQAELARLAGRLRETFSSS